jgi:phage/plasmid-associated DNA primase
LKQPETLKILSSGESTVGRGIGENIRIINNIPLIICNTNRKITDKESLPKDSQTDISVSRRLLLISFDKKVSEEDRNPELVQMLLKEKEGIFMWLIQGYKRLKRDKYKITESLEGRIDKIRFEMNGNVNTGVGNTKVSGAVTTYLEFKGFVNMPDEEHPYEHMVRFSTLYENFSKFCVKNGIKEDKVISTTKFGRDLTTLGFIKKDNIGDTNRTGYMIYSSSESKSAVIHSIPSIIEQLNIDALLAEAEAEELEFEIID